MTKKIENSVSHFICLLRKGHLAGSRKLQKKKKRCAKLTLSLSALILVYSQFHKI